MPYATQQDIIDRYSEEQYLVAFDRDGDGIADNAAVERALADASGEIDGYLAGRYPLPLTAAQAKILTGYCVDIALYKGSVALAQTEEKRKRYEDAAKFLRLVGEGKIRLGLPAAEEPAGNDQVLVAGATPTFTRDTLERF